MSIGAGKTISVSNGVGTATATVAIQATSPGVFTIDGSGSGAAAALNYNATTGMYSVNSTSNTAKLGDTIVLYVTGEGDFAPTITSRTGLIVPSTLSPIPQVSPLPLGTIGGATATVTYAGPSIGSILGLLQVNVVVPSASTTGNAVPVSIAIGGTASQTTATVALK